MNKPNLRTHPHADDWVTTEQIAAAVGLGPASIRANWPRRYKLRPINDRWPWPDVEYVLLKRITDKVGNGATMRDIPPLLAEEPFGPRSVNDNWRPIPGYEIRYEVSSCGQVRSLRTGKVLVPIPAHAGHLQVNLYPAINGRMIKFIHRLVLEAFVGPCPDGMECRHLNGNPADNRLENLRWGTKAENMADTLLHGTHHQVKKTHCPQGHEYTPANTYAWSGRRYCRTCRLEYGQAWREQHRAA